MPIAPLIQLVAGSLIAMNTLAQPVPEAEHTTVHIDFGRRWILDGVSRLDRLQYFNLHMPAAVPEGMVPLVMDELDLNFGRLQGGGIAEIVWAAFEESGHPDFSEWIQQAPPLYPRVTIHREYPERTRLVVTGVGEPSALLDGPEEYTVRRNKNAILYYRDLKEMTRFIVDVLRYQVVPYFDGTIAYFELSNEPEGWWAHDWNRLADLYVSVGRKMSDVLPEIKVGGPCMFAPYVFVRDFSPWHEGIRPFMDRTGDVLGHVSFHSYDFYRNAQQEALVSDSRLTSGGHNEARLDLLENHAMNQFGKVLPLFLSEVGGYDSDLANDPDMKNDPVLTRATEELQNWLMINSANRQTMSFLHRPGRVLQSIPFILGDTYHWNPDYYASMLRRRSDGTHRVTSLRHFYDLWAGINGDRVYIEPMDPNLAVAAFVDGLQGHVVLENFSLEPRTVRLDLGEVGATSPARVRRLHFDPTENAVIWREDPETDTTALRIGGHEKVRVDFNWDVEAVTDRGAVEEVWFYGDRTVVPIQAEEPLDFSFETGDADHLEYALLRVGFGRAHELARFPRVLFNGTELQVPTTDWGGDQSDLPARLTVAPVPVPTDLIQAHNEARIIFPDDGGDVSTVILVLGQKQ